MRRVRENWEVSDRYSTKIKNNRMVTIYSGNDGGKEGKKVSCKVILSKRKNKKRRSLAVRVELKYF